MSELESWKTEVPATHFSRTRTMRVCLFRNTHVETSAADVGTDHVRPRR
jgi:hypothetical protein